MTNKPRAMPADAFQTSAVADRIERVAEVNLQHYLVALEVLGECAGMDTRSFSTHSGLEWFAVVDSIYGYLFSSQ